MDPRFVRTRAEYDADAEDFARRNADAPESLVAFRRQFAARLSAGARIADLGCGPGRDARAFLDAEFGVVGVDASHAMAALARRAGVPVVVGDLRRPSLRRESFAGLWSVASLLHVPSSDLAATLLSWRALLQPGGRLGLSTSVGGTEGWDRPADSGGRWIANHSVAGLLTELDRAGFAVEDCQEVVTHRRWVEILATAAE